MIPVLIRMMIRMMILDDNGENAVPRQVCDYVRISIRANNPSLHECNLLKFCGHSEYAVLPHTLRP